MPIVIAVLAFITVLVLLFGLVGIVEQRKLLKDRMMQFTQEDIQNRDVILTGSLFQRLFKPVLQVSAKHLVGRTSQSAKDTLRKQLLMAGSPGNLQVIEFIALQFLLTGLTFLVLLVLPVSFLVVCLFTIVSWLAPTFYLRQLVAKRQLAISLAIPDVMDLLTVSVEAGLGFDGAVAKVVEKSHGPLADELKRTLHEIRIGKPRRDALRNLSSRTGVAYLQSFVAAIVQADQLGVSIGKVLRIQAIEIRRQRRQKAEEQAMKAPIKMLFPLVIFVFPTLFIVLLGPAAINFMYAFQ